MTDSNTVELEFTADDDGRLVIDLSRPFGTATPTVRSFANSETVGLIVEGLDPGEIVDVHTAPHRVDPSLDHRERLIHALKLADDRTDGALTTTAFNRLTDDSPHHGTVATRFGTWRAAFAMADIDLQTTTACPSCGHSKIQERTTMEPRYRCANCGHRFDEPMERPIRSGGP